MKHNIATLPFPKRAFRWTDGIIANMYQKYSFKSSNALRNRAGENLKPHPLTP